jgi:hypothetical protein
MMMEGKFSGEGLDGFDEDDDMMSSMVRELLEEGGVGTPIGPCSAAPIPRSTSSKSCFVAPKSRQRSSTAVRLWRTSGGRTARS